MMELLYLILVSIVFFLIGFGMGVSSSGNPSYKRRRRGVTSIYQTLERTLLDYMEKIASGEYNPQQGSYKELGERVNTLEELYRFYKEVSSKKEEMKLQRKVEKYATRRYYEEAFGKYLRRKGILGRLLASIFYLGSLRKYGGLQVYFQLKELERRGVLGILYGLLAATYRHDVSEKEKEVIWKEIDKLVKKYPVLELEVKRFLMSHEEMLPEEIDYTMLGDSRKPKVKEVRRFGRFLDYIKNLKNYLGPRPRLNIERYREILRKEIRPLPLKREEEEKPINFIVKELETRRVNSRNDARSRSRNVIDRVRGWVRRIFRGSKREDLDYVF